MKQECIRNVKQMKDKLKKNYSDYYQSSNILSYEIDDNLKEKINCDVIEKMNLIKKEEEEKRENKII